MCVWDAAFQFSQWNKILRCLCGLQEVLELAFSVLYDPDETLNFVAPNKYEVSLSCVTQHSTLSSCGAGPGCDGGVLLVSSWAVLHLDRWAVCAAGQRDGERPDAQRLGHTHQHGDEAPPPRSGEHHHPGSPAAGPQRAELVQFLLQLQLRCVCLNECFFWVFFGIFYIF